MNALYPLRFREILRNYNFGDRWIVEAFDKDGLPENHRVAETWEVCDRPGESSVVTNGEYAGRSLHDLIAEHGEELLGRDVVAVTGSRFPLLVKFLDATHLLGEQVHPDDALAAEQKRADPGKTEAWYMLKTRPGATIHCGDKEGVSHDDVYQALLEGTILDVMDEQGVRPGDPFLLHAGTMHYTHGGVLFYEILQNSDAGISLVGKEYPAGTNAREQWARDTIVAVRPVKGGNCRISPVTVAVGENSVSYILASKYFALERIDLESAHAIACTGDKFCILTQIEGESTVSSGRHAEKLYPGHTCLLPASLGTVSVTPNGRCSILKAYVPDLMRDIVNPLRGAGVSDRDIVQLGGEPEFNVLIELLG
jgi:mannose-6-phosphate isomerase